jgi:hypothetical protein
MGLQREEAQSGKPDPSILKDDESRLDMLENLQQTRRQTRHTQWVMFSFYILGTALLAGAVLAWHYAFFIRSALGR